MVMISGLVTTIGSISDGASPQMGPISTTCPSRGSDTGWSVSGLGLIARRCCGISGRTCETFARTRFPVTRSDQ